MSELSKMIEALVKDLEQVLESKDRITPFRMHSPNTTTEFKQWLLKDMEQALAFKQVRDRATKDRFLFPFPVGYTKLGGAQVGTKPAFDPEAVRKEIYERLAEDEELYKQTMERQAYGERCELLAGNRYLNPKEDAEIPREKAYSCFGLGPNGKLRAATNTGERTLMEHHREQDRVRSEDRAERLRAVLDSCKIREQVLNEAGLDGKNVEERVKPLAQALSQVEDMRVSISLADRERLVALLHSQTRLTDERVEDIACVLSDAQPVPTDLRPLLQDNLKALGKTLYWLRECLRDADDQFIRQHLSQGLELIQTQMGKTERAIEENKDEQ